jgi:hypothetical protein
MNLSNIFEAIDPPVLYHGTSLAKLVSMFQDDVMHGQIDRLASGPVMNTAGPVGVSLTRDRRTAQSHAQKDAHNHVPGAVLVFDRDKLAHHFGRRLRPIDVLRIRGYTGNPFTGSEFEERLAGDLTHLTSFVKRVMVDRAAFDDFEKTALADDPTLQPVFRLIRAKM